ncbi:MAG TPA: sugar ABC transporter permease [Chloroflexota bacterium]|nr:sugar ABC transporter permease [Chloroflexota bacterium]
MSTLQVAARGAMTRSGAGRGTLGRDWQLGFVLIAPVFLVIAGLVAYPLGYSIWLSLQDVKVGAPGTFVGLNNYYKILFDSEARIHASFWASLKITVLYVGGACLGKLIIGMISALILNAEIKARHFWRSLLFLPWAIPGVVAAYTWKFIYNDVNGVANAALTNIGLIDAPILFLAKPENALWSVLVGVIWQGAPFWTMTFLAGLQSIPGELYEAAEIDGATTFKSFVHITLPSISSVIVVTVMLSTIWTTNGIEFIYTLTNGGPGGATETFPLLAIAQGLRAYDLGIGSTIPLLFFPFFAVMIYFLTRRLLNNEEA